MEEYRLSFDVKRIGVFPLSTTTKESKRGDVVFSRIVSKKQTFFRLKLKAGDFLFTYKDGKSEVLVESYTKIPHKPALVEAFKRVWRDVFKLTRGSIESGECALEIVEMLENKAIPFLNNVFEIYLDEIKQPEAGEGLPELIPDYGDLVWE